jgi:hypothetical protein
MIAYCYGIHLKIDFSKTCARWSIVRKSVCGFRKNEAAKQGLRAPALILSACPALWSKVFLAGIALPGAFAPNPSPSRSNA